MKLENIKHKIDDYFENLNDEELESICKRLGIKEEKEESNTCWIMHKISVDMTFVTTNEDYAKKLYDSGEYHMRESKIFNP